MKTVSFVDWTFSIQFAKRNLKKKDICNFSEKKNIVNFAFPADHRVKLKENEKKDKYFDFDRELKKKNCGT